MGFSECKGNNKRTKKNEAMDCIGKEQYLFVRFVCVAMLFLFASACMNRCSMPWITFAARGLYTSAIFAWIGIWFFLMNGKYYLSWVIAKSPYFTLLWVECHCSTPFWFCEHQRHCFYSIQEPSIQGTTIKKKITSKQRKQLFFIIIQFYFITAIVCWINNQTKTMNTIIFHPPHTHCLIFIWPCLIIQLRICS